MRKLWLTYSSQTTAVLGALLVGWSRMGRSRAGCRARDCQASDPVFSATSPGQLLPAAPAPGGEHWPQPQQHSPPAARRGPAERLPPAAGTCRPTSSTGHPPPHLQPGPCSQVLRLLNLTWLPKPSGRAMTPGPGFPRLEELCLASSTCNFVSNEVLDRLLHGSPHLRLLDLRGCARITPAGLHDLPCQGQHCPGGGWAGGRWGFLPTPQLMPIPLTSRAGAASLGPVWHVGPADSSQGGQPSVNAEVVPHSAGAGLEWPGLQREGPGTGLSCLLRHPWGLAPGTVLPQPPGHPGHTRHGQVSIPTPARSLEPVWLDPLSCLTCQLQGSENGAHTGPAPAWGWP